MTGTSMAYALADDAGDDCDTEAWEPWHADVDASEAHDLAQRHPEKPKALIALWWNEARRHGVLPLDERRGGELRGSCNGGRVLCVKDRRLVFDDNRFHDHSRVESGVPLPAGPCTVAIPTMATTASSLGMDIGRSAAPVTHDYEPPLVFEGRLERVVFDVAPDGTTPTPVSACAGIGPDVPDGAAADVDRPAVSGANCAGLRASARRGARPDLGDELDARHIARARLRGGRWAACPVVRAGCACRPRFDRRRVGMRGSAPRGEGLSLGGVPWCIGTGPPPAGSPRAACALAAAPGTMGGSGPAHGVLSMSPARHPRSRIAHHRRGPRLRAEATTAMALQTLIGVRVLDLTGRIPGPCASAPPGDPGADVVGSESPEGCAMRTHPSTPAGDRRMSIGTDRNERGIVMDIEQAAAREAPVATGESTRRCCVPR